MFRCAVIDLLTGAVLNMIIADPAVDPAPQGTSLMRVGTAPIDARYKRSPDGSYTFVITQQDLVNYIAREAQVVSEPATPVGEVKLG